MSRKKRQWIKSRINIRLRCIAQIQTLFFAIMLLMFQNTASQQKVMVISPLAVATTITPKLTLRSCCKYNDEENCEEFLSPQEMFGIGCCHAQPMNVFEEICCDGMKRRRRQSQSDGTFSYVEYCCGNQTLSFSQTCCQGVVHNLPNGKCCGAQTYPSNNVNVLCCNGILNVNVKPGFTCCGTTPYDGGLHETCCGNSVYLKEFFDGCCAVHGSNLTEFQQFNSKTHLCCDVPIERYSNTKCCYLRNDVTSQFYPKNYDSSKSCCVFPYTDIAPKNRQGTCLKVTAPPPTISLPTTSAPPTSQGTDTEPNQEFTNQPNPFNPSASTEDGDGNNTEVDIEEIVSQNRRNEKDKK